MKRSTKMLMMSSGNRSSDRGREDSGRENRGYERRDAYDGGIYDRGRERNDNGRYATMREESGGYIESRFRDRDGREHYDNGRFAPMRNSYDGGAYDNYGTEMHYPMTPYVPPIYQDRGGRRDSYRRDSGQNISPMNKIGFAVEGEMDRLPEMDHNYRQMQEYKRMNEMQYGKTGERMAGYSQGSGYIPFTREIAEEWTSDMENEDGTRGPHWTMEQTKQVQAQRGIECDPLEFWTAMNMIYSDYCKAAKKANANTIDFYADMAKAFLDDKDAPEDKLARYYYYIADAKA